MHEEEKLEAKCFNDRALREIRWSVNFLERDGHSQNPFGRKGFQLSYYRLNHIKLQKQSSVFSLRITKRRSKEKKA